MSIPQRIRDELLVEAQHRCTICSERCFEIHHIVERADGGTDDPDNLLVLCPNCHQHRYHRHNEFTRDQLLLYKANLKEFAEIERRLLQNLEDLRASIAEKSAAEVEQELKRELDEASCLIDPNRRPRLAASIEETARTLAEAAILPDASRRAIELQYEIKRQRAKAQHREIDILGVDNDAYRKSTEFPSAYEFVLILNDTPQRDWCEVFDREYRDSWYNMKRETSIRGNRLVMIIADSDNLQWHVDWAKGLVKQTNEWIRTHGFRYIDSQIEQAKNRALEEFDAIQSMKDRTRNLKV